MKVLLKTSILLLFFTLFTSCNVLKEYKKNKTHTETAENRTIVENESRFVYKPKDSVVFVSVPNVVYKDTTIVKRGQTTTLRLNYNAQGSMTQADCVSDEFKEFIVTQRQINEKILTKLDKKEKTKEVEKTPNVLFWIFGILAFFLLLFYLL